MAKEQPPQRRFKFLPLSFRLETLGGVATPLVLRGTPLPTKRVETFTTAVDNQSSVEVHVLMGESPVVERCVSLGKFKLEGIAPAPRGTPQVRTTFDVDEQCAVHVTAAVEGTTMETSEVLKPDRTMLSDEAIATLRQQAEDHKEVDERRVSLIEARNSAEQAIAKAEARLAEHAAGGAPGTDPATVKEKIAILGQALESGDVDRVREGTQSLSASLAAPQGLDFGSLFGSGTLGDFFTATPRVRTSNQPRPKAERPTTTKPVAKQPDSAPSVLSRTRVSPLSLGKIFGGGEFTLDPNFCFVLMPFVETFRPIYDDHIRAVVQREGVSCLRSDEIRGTSLITRDIWEKINRARFLIADLTGQNPNVFYEVGLAHALGKDVVLLTQTMTDVPFDLKAMRCIVYAYTPPGMKEMETALRATVAALMKSG